MYSYEDLFLDDPVTSHKRLLTRASRRRSYRNPGTFLEEGVLTKLVTFARTRQHNQYPGRPTSFCAVCCTMVKSPQKCRRWNAFRLPELPQDSESATLQPYCEVLGSSLCSDCSLEQTKQNHMLHLPAIFGAENYCTHKTAPKEANGKVLGSLTRVAERKELAWTLGEGVATNGHEWDDRQFMHYVPRPFRNEMEYLATLPDLLGQKKYKLRKRLYKEWKAMQPPDEMKFDARNMLESSLNSSVSRSFDDFNLKKLLKPRTMKVPHPTPKEDPVLSQNTNTKQFDVIELAQKLQDVYKERNFKFSKLGSFPDNGSILDHSSLISNQESSLFDDRVLDSMAFESKDSFLIQNNSNSYRNLSLSPATTDMEATKRIQKNLLDPFGRLCNEENDD